MKGPNVMKKMQKFELPEELATESVQHLSAAEKKLAAKRKRTPDELQQMKQVLEESPKDNHTSKLDTENKTEPTLLRYEITESEFDENITNANNSTPINENKDARRSCYKKKPRNCADGSVNYGFSRSSSSSQGSGNSSLPPIAENSVTDNLDTELDYGVYRPRGGSVYGNRYKDRMSDCESRYEDNIYSEFSPKFNSQAYFPHPATVKGFAAKGSHPDSLYRVSLGGASQPLGLSQKLYLLIRWPLMLLIVCVCLGLFIYIAMPDSPAVSELRNNSTLWEDHLQKESQSRKHEPNKLSSVTTNGNISEKENLQHDTETSSSSTLRPKKIPKKTPEIDFNDAGEEYSNELKQLLSVAKKMPDNEKAKSTVSPIFPKHISLEVRYGNEDSDPQSKRNAKLYGVPFSNELTGKLTTSRPDFTIATGKDYSVTVKETTPTVPYESSNAEDFAIQSEIPTITQESSLINNDPNVAFIAPTDDTIDNKETITSGHSNIFGLSIEDAATMRTTTDNPQYHTRVSPTLPTLKYIDSVTPDTISSNETEGLLECESTKLAVCRGAMPYDLTNAEMARIPSHQRRYLEELATNRCSPRAQEFACTLLEPECSPSGIPAKLPCQNLCKNVMKLCEIQLGEESQDCSEYPTTNCIDAREPCRSEEIPCGDGNCIPAQWRCDGRPDCYNGTDEQFCETCPHGKFRCRKGDCISNRWQCDGYVDCPFADDEDDELCLGKDVNPLPHVKVEPEGISGALPGTQGEESAPRPAVAEFGADFNNENQRPFKEIDFDKGEILETSDTVYRRNYTRTPQRKPTSQRRTTTTTTTTTVTPAHDYDDILNDDGISSEEVTKVLGKYKTEKLRLPEPYREAPSCIAGELRCVDGRCITLEQLCDGKPDCSDRADEENCFA